MNARESKKITKKEIFKCRSRPHDKAYIGLVQSCHTRTYVVELLAWQPQRLDAFLELTVVEILMSKTHRLDSRRHCTRHYQTPRAFQTCMQIRELACKRVDRDC